MSKILIVCLIFLAGMFIIKLFSIYVYRDGVPVVSTIRTPNYEGTANAKHLDFVITAKPSYPKKYMIKVEDDDTY